MQKLEHIVFFVLLMFATGAGQAFFATPYTLSRSTGQPLTEAAFALIYLVLILFLVKYRTSALNLLLTEKWLAALCVWALASVAWSVGPEESLRRALALTGTTIAGLYLGLHFEPKQQLKMIAYAIGLGAIASVVVIIAIPSVGITSDGMQGVYNLKNSLGRMMSLGAFCFALLVLGERRRRAVSFVMFLLCCTLLVLSKSATALVVTMLMLALLPFRRMLYLRTRQLLATGAILIPLMTAATFWVVESSGEILKALGRSSSLSGRIPLWQFVLKSISDHPIRGYGFTAFWNSWTGERVSDTVNWDTAVPHAHNGFLEVWLGLGLIGLVLILINLSRNFLFALRVARSNREVEYSWPLLLIVFTVLYNVTENSLLAVNTLPWIAYAAASYWLARAAREEAVEPEPQSDAEPAYSA
ncbi:MAG: O-antigen ligase family protein [Terracidiphilus sp.]